MELLVIIIFIYAVKSAVDDTRSALRNSRDAYGKSADLRFPGAGKSRRTARAARHDAGFWAGQAAHGFPAARHGLAAGWHAGRQAQAEGRAERERAKTEHLETRVRLIPEIREHFLRQSQALAQIRAEREAQVLGSGEGSPQSVMAPPQHVPGVVRGRGPARRNGDTVVYRDPALWPGEAPGSDETAADPGEGREGSGEGSPVAPAVPSSGPQRRVCVACGNPEYGPRGDGGNWGPLVTYAEPLFPDDPPTPRLMHKAHFEDEATGLYGRPYEPAAAPDGGSGQPGDTSEGSGEGTAAPDTEPPASPAEGEPTVPAAADTTYGGVLASMSAAKDDAEAKSAEQQQASKHAGSMADEMQAMEVDPTTLSAMADHLDAHETAVKALQRVQETAETVEAAMKRGHAGLAEAHANAPVQAATREFYDS
jgi:hypothetical protein